MNGRDRRAVVVGGGIIGATTAYYLSRDGWRVTVLDRARFGEGAAIGNCGLISPSHILPLAEPGLLRKTTLRAMLRPDAPLAVKPVFNLALWSWLLNFARRCNTRDMMDAARGIQAMLESSLARYRELLEAEDLACEWESKGLLMPFRDPAAMAAYAETEHLLATEFDYPARRFDGAAITELEPALKPGLAGGWLYERDAHLRTDRLLASWRRILEARGATIREHCTVAGFSGPDGRARAVVTAQGEEIPAEAIVVAAGALTPMLGEQLGARIPIQPGKGYSLTMPRPAICPRIPLLFLEKRVIATPFQSGYRLGSTMEFAGYDDTLNRRRLQFLKEGAEPYLKEPYREPIEQEWFGWRPMTYDSLPIIDFAPRFGNVLIAAGHGMLGLTMAPGTARLVSELLAGARPHLDPRPYRLSRFAV